MPESRPPTALISAHARFREGLLRRGRELVELVERAQRSDTTPGPRASRAVDGGVEEELSRRVHALYASAEVFQEENLTRAARDVARQLDLAREQRRKLSRVELRAVMALAEQLGATPEPGAVASERPPRAVPVAETLAGTLETPDVIAVLLVGSREVEASLREALPVERCELTTSQEIEVALDVVDSVAPDLVLVEAALLAGMPAAECLSAMTVLRGERNALARALALIAEQGGEGDAELLARTRADAVLRLPLASATLLERLHRFARGSVPSKLGLEPLSGGTVEQIAASVADQVRRGILEAVRTGREERIDLGAPADQAELLAATWSAVSRIRAHLSELTDGRVRFDPRATGPAALALTDPQPAEPYVGLGDPLQGRRILIADDDPAVVWFFAGLLREAGAVVVEASDGQSALELARRKPLDLVISDILMPGVDGFALCRELRRDLALAYVPVILISWKEDFLQRMRELDAGAAGYLRKEAGSHQILSTVAQVLAPRSELEALLASGDEVRGRIDALGAERLVRTVASQRPDARITLRDALNLFEIDVRAGNNLSITRTAADGTFARGRAALRQLVGVTTGRYTISSVETPIRGAFSEPLDKVLSDAVRDMGALLDAVSDAFLLRVERVLLDDEVLSAMLAITPTELADVAARLRGAEPVSRLVLSGRWSARELEEHLRELVRRGAIVAVQGPANEDLAAEARATRERDPSALLHASTAVRRSTVPPPTTLGDADVDWVDEDAALDAALAPSSAFVSDAPPSDEHGADLSTTPTEPPEPDETDELDAPDDDHEPIESIEPEPIGDSQPPDDGEAVQGRTSQAPPRRTPEPEPEGWGWVRFTWLLIALFALSYVVWSVARPSGEQAARTAKVVQPAPLPSAPPTTPGSPDAPAPGGASARHDGPQDDHPIAPPPPEGAGATPASAAPSAPAAPSGVEFGRVLPFIDRSRGVDVAPTQGLLVAEHAAKGAPGAAALRVRIDGKDRGTLPLALALDAGRHELVLVRRDGTSFRYVMIRAGETRIVAIDP